jgi:hypothetical protein
MSRRAFLILPAVALLLGFAPGPAARAQDVTRVPDLTGFWRLDAAHSDNMNMQRPEGGGGGAGEESGGGRGGRSMGRGGWGGGGGGGMRRGGGGGWGGRGGQGRGSSSEGGGEGRGAAAGARPVRLPDLMHVTQTDNMVSFEDSTGTVLEEITTLGAARDTLLHAPGASVVAGAWKDSALTVERSNPRGKATQTYTLKDDGATLVIQTHIEASGGQMPARDFKRVYKRTSGS